MNKGPVPRALHAGPIGQLLRNVGIPSPAEDELRLSAATALALMVALVGSSPLSVAASQLCQLHRGTATPFALLTLVQADAPKLSLAATTDYQAAISLYQRGSYDLAAQACKRFIENYPQDTRVADAYFFWGISEYMQQNFAEAVRVLAEAEKRLQDPQRRQEAVYFQGVSLLRLAQAGAAARAAEAVAVFDRFLKSFPNSPRAGEALYCRGEALILTGQKLEAARSYQEAVTRQLTPAIKAAARYNLAVCLEDLQRPQEALEQYEAFLREFPEDALAADAAVRAGDLYFTQKRYDQARVRFEQALGAKDVNVAAYALLRCGDAAAAAGQLPEAVRLYQKLRQQFGDTEYAERAALAAGNVLRRLQQWDDAIREYREVIRSGKSAAEEAAVLMVETLLDAGKAEEARVEAERLLPQVKNPAFVDQLELVRAEGLAISPEKASQALEAFSKLADKQPTSGAVVSAAFRAGWLAVELAEAEVALRYLRRFLELAPTDPRVPQAQFLIAEAQLLAAQLDEAERSYRLVSERYAKDKSLAEAAQVRLLWISFLRGQHSQVISRGGELARGINNPQLLAEVYYLIGASHFEQRQFTEAIKTLDQVLKVAPGFRMAGEAQIYLGRAHLRLNDTKKAAEVLQGLIRSADRPQIVHEAHLWLAEAEYRSGNRGDAIKRYRMLLREDLSRDLGIRVRYALAAILAEENAAAEALRLLDELLTGQEQHPLVPDAVMLKTRLLLQMQRPTEAVATLERWLQSNPQGAQASQARFLLACCYIDLQNPRPAIKILEELLAKPPQDVDESEILYQLGWAYKLDGNHERTTQIFKELLGRAGKKISPEVLYEVGEYFFAEKDYSSASKAFYHVAGTKGPTVSAETKEKSIHRYGWCNFRLKLYKESRIIFAHQLREFPDGPLAADGRLMLAECCVQLAREQKRGAAPADALAAEETLVESARKLYQEAWEQYQILVGQLEKLSEADYRPLALLRAGETAAQLGLWEESERLLKRCLDEYPGSPYRVDALCQRGWALWKLGRVAEAVETLTTAGRTDNSASAARARFLLGEIHFFEKRYAEAIIEFMAVAYGYGFPELRLLSLYEAARCYEQMKRIGEARKLYQEIVDEFGATQDPKVDIARRKLQTLPP